ncbi:unknown [Clostridium sp. CAG:1013]|nr:unknown [Clostridium sp. CAG:1013]
MIGNQGGQILQGVQGLAPVADDESDILAGEDQRGAALFLLDLNGSSGQAHLPQHAHKIIRGFLSRVVFFLNVGPHLGGAAAEQTEGLFLGHL